MAPKALTRKPSRIQRVPFSEIFIPPALITQRNFRQAHADYIAANMDLNKLGFPAVNHRDGRYRMWDGQHRYRALLMWDPSLENSTLECEVFEDLTDAEEAEMFLGRDARKAIPPFDKFHVACTAGRVRENAIRRTVEANGQKIARDHNEGISVVGALGKVYDQCGDVVLGKVIRTINLGFGGDPLGFDRCVVEGLGMLYNRFDGRTNEKALGHRLRDLKQGARELLLKAESLRVKTGQQKKHCMAAVIVEVYNKGEGSPHSKSRLPSWWKDTQAPA